MTTLYEQYLSRPDHYRLCSVNSHVVVSRTGHFISFVRGEDSPIVLSQRIGKPSATMIVTTEGRTVTVHNEVARLFVGNPNSERYTHVLHKDGDASNNNASNLMWVTRAERTAWREDLGVIKTYRRPMFLEHIETGDVYESAAKAARVIGVDTGTVIKYARNGNTIPKTNYTLRQFEGTERIKFWLSDTKKWVKHPKYDNYLVSEDGFVIKLDSDGGLGSPLKNYIRPDGTVWVRTDRKETMKDLMTKTFGQKDKGYV